MKTYFYIVLLFCPYLQILLGQDTIAVDIGDAIKIALNNNAYRFVCQEINEVSPSFSLPPLEIEYKYGQLYSSDVGWMVELSQDFGTLYSLKANTDLQKAIRNYKKNKTLLDKKNFEIEIKSVYMQWLYYFNILSLIDIKREYTLKSISVSNLKADLGESEPIDNLFTELQASRTETDYLEYQYNLDITENKLRGLLNTDKHLKPKRTVLEMYMVHKKDDTSAFNGDYTNDIILDRYYLGEAELNLKKKMRLPQFQAGLFYQDISSYSNLKGIQAGVKIPLWNSSVKSRFQQEKIQTEQLLMEYKVKKQQSELEIENLIMELDKLFIRIRHYQNHAIPAANMLLNASEVKYQKEEVEFEEYFEMVNQALEIKQDYLELIYTYNLTALKLELYTK